MAVTLQQIANYLEQRNLRYQLQPEHGRILTGVTADHADYLLIVVQLDEDGEFFKLFAPDVLAGVKEHRYKEAILQTLLSISWETKMLQWEYDPVDGEIRAMIEFPLEDSTLTEKQFYRCLSGLVEMVDTIALPRLITVMQSGQDPGDLGSLSNLEAGERLLLTLQEEAPGLLDVLEKAMEARKRRGYPFQPD